MQTERKYAFRTELNLTHKPDRRISSVDCGKDETELTDDWRIIIAKDASIVIANAAKDLAEYLSVSMNVACGVKKADGPREKKTITITIGENKKNLRIPGSYIVEAGNESIAIYGYDARGAAQGVYYIQDVMNLKEAPCFPKGTFKREPLFSPRMTHSGWGHNQFPDNHLKAIARSGIDSILLFTKDVDETTTGYLDFNELIERAASFGLDVYLYSYLKSLKHPRDKNALEFYENSYGRLFKECPGAKGIILVGESCEFPSHDIVNTTGSLDNFNDGLRQPKPSPGWWPCYDYPEWLDILKKVIHKNKKDAEIVFWTYNWGYAPEKDRIKLIESLPKDVSLLVTFEMFEEMKHENISDVCMDYSISFPGPGKYFISEAKAAKKKNIKLYTMSNTAGMTWDFGVVPYIPVPYQWGKRNDALHNAREKWNLSGLMESHHYGIYPSEISELAKWSFWNPSPSPEELMKQIAERDFGRKSASKVLKAWKLWSEGMDDYIPSNEDQYGPCRVGPSYPLIFHPDITRRFEPQEIVMPSVRYAHFGSKIVKTFYHPFENAQQSPGAMRYPIEIKHLSKMLAKWNDGLECLEKIANDVPCNKKRNLEKMLALGTFIANTLKTTINVKTWWILNMQLFNEKNKTTILNILAQLEDVALKEIDNAKKTIPIVESHSRLGWEPSMEYMTDREHLEWKIKQVRIVLDYEIPAYKKIIRLG